VIAAIETASILKNHITSFASKPLHKKLSV
ncbi:MAG: hypothetical protein ACI92E_001277, partial [Oceanicoccus sp.]